ncbi:MAG: acyl carrier protein [Rickettsiaceae bacterium H1]|nr:acyl carrier protein [Rickettsiaceae bacterium H1]
MEITRDEVKDKVKEIIIKTLKVSDENKVMDSAKFVDDLGADSLDQIDFIMEVEDHYKIEIPDEDVEKILTVGDAVIYIADKVSNN